MRHVHPWLATLLLVAPATARGEPQADAPYAAEPPSDAARETTLEVVRDTSPVPGDRTFPRRLMVRASAAGHLPLVGPMADLGNAGVGLRLGLGWYFLRRIAAVAELGGGLIPRATGDDRGHTLASALALLRATVVLDEALTLFGEAGGGVAVSTADAHPNVNLDGARPMAALAASAGLEIDLLGWVSGEGGARLEVFFAERTWGATSVVATPYIATTLHF